MTAHAEPERHTSRIIVRNTILTTGVSLVMRVISFLFGIYVVRQLGEVDFGSYSVALAWAGLFGFLGDLGITQYMTRETARVPERAAELFWDVAALRLLLSVLTAVITIGGAISRSFSFDVVLAIALLTATYFFQALLAPLSAVIVGNERLDIASFLGLIGQIIYMGLGFVFLSQEKGFVWLVIASLVMTPIGLVLSLLALRWSRMTIPRFHITPGTWRALLVAGLPFALTQLALTFNFKIDTILLEAFWPVSVVGWYNIAYSLSRTMLIFFSGFIVALPLSMSREHEQNPDAIQPWYERSIRLIAFVGLPMAVGGTLLADPIMLLIYGVNYLPSAPVFAVLMWDVPLLMYTALCGNLMGAMKLERQSMRIYVAIGLSNLLLNLLFIPSFGIVAASLTTVGAELTGTLLFYTAFRRQFDTAVQRLLNYRLLLALAFMGLVVYGLRDHHVLVAVVGGSLSYAACVWGLGALNAEERGAVRQLIQRLLRPLLRA